MNVEVTSVARRGQKLSDTAAAVFVITQEDIRRSGATSIPEVLRTVPGLHVAQISAHVWAITARGFNGRYANKLLVLVDGRRMPGVPALIFESKYLVSGAQPYDTLVGVVEKVQSMQQERHA